MDRSWCAAYRAACSVLNPNDFVLAPIGSWPRFPCRVSFYSGPFALGDATVLLLHKGRITFLAKSVLSEIVRGWHCIYAGDVFVVLAAKARPSFGLSRALHEIHMLPVRNYLRSRRIKKLPGTIYFAHVPKTGGTSMWQMLRRTFPSNVYYSDIQAFLAHPPAAGEYDLVGLHFMASPALPLLRGGDWLIGMLRSPTERFLSGIVHARRPHEDPATFTVAMRAMREMTVPDFLLTEVGRIEARLQLVILGGDHRQPLACQSDEEMLQRAADLLHRPSTLFAPSDQSDQFNRLLSHLFAFRPRRLGSLNVNARSAYSSHAEEFDRARPAIERENSHEQRLYEVVRASFAERVP